MAKSDALLESEYFAGDISQQQAMGITRLTLRTFITATLRPATAALLCYSLGWLSGLIMLLVRRKDGFVRFHAWQSIIVSGIATVPIVIFNLLMFEDSFLYWFSMALYWIIVMFSLYLWLVLMWRAYRGEAYSLCAVGTVASNLSRTWGSLAGGGARLSTIAQKVRATALTVAEPEKKVLPDSEDSTTMLTETVNTIIAMGETRDPYTATHQQRVAQYACAIAREMGLSEDRVEGLRVMGAIHDIGKVAVPVEILSKPGKLNAHEFGIIKTHPEVAHNIVKGLKFPWPVAQAIVQHHERLDGSGYPQGLSGDEIILEARILSVADVVEAMASHRPYRPALGLDKALEEIKRSKGSLYDASVVEACVNLVNRKVIQ